MANKDGSEEDNSLEPVRPRSSQIVEMLSGGQEEVETSCEDQVDTLQ